MWKYAKQYFLLTEENGTINEHQSSQGESMQRVALEAEPIITIF